MARKSRYKKHILLITLKRYFELSITSAIISTIISLLNLVGFFRSSSQLAIVLTSGVVIFTYANYRMQRQSGIDIAGKVMYFLVNGIAYMAFMLSAFVAMRFDNIVFTFLFAITKFLRYSNLNLSILASIGIFHIVGIINMIFAQIGTSNPRIYYR